MEIDKQRIIKALMDTGASLPCPRCGNQNFSITEGYFAAVIQNDLKKLELGGSNIPSAIVICPKCGFIAFHALGALDLLPQNEEGEEQSND